jgi:adenine/guanine/hypoxanthine permease
MSYIVAVNPAILKEAGIPPGPSMVATIVAAVAGTLIMGLYANRPFAIAPYMGENAFIAFSVVKMMGFTWQTALAAVFISGVLFVALTVAQIRQWLLESVPPGLRYSFAAGIGLFLAFIGMNEAGIVTLGVPGAPVRIGVLSSPQVLIAIGCFLLIATLLLREVPGAILIGIIAAAVASFVLGLAPPPARWVGAPPDLRPLLFQIDLRHAFSLPFMGVLLTVFMMAFIDTLGSLIGLSARAGFLDQDGRLPQSSARCWLTRSPPRSRAWSALPRRAPISNQPLASPRAGAPGSPRW